MRVLGAVVQVATGSMLHLGQAIAVRNAIAAKAIGDDALWLVLQPSEQALEETLGGRGVPAVLNQDIEYHTVLVHRAPEVVQLAIDLQEHLIEVPSVARLRPATAKLAGDIGAELEAPLPYALVGDRDAPLGQEQFHVAQAQAEDMVQPDSMADDLGREAVSGIGGGLGRHPASMPQPLRFGQKLRSWQCQRDG